MAELGLASDVAPWTPDTFGNEVAPPSFGSATGDSLRSYGGEVVGPDTSFGPGRTAIDDFSQDIPIPSEKPKAPGFWDRQKSAYDASSKRIDEALGSWQEHPWRRMAYIIQAGLAGFSGQKPAWLDVTEKYEKQQGLDLTRSLTGIQVIEHAQKIGSKLAPDKRAEYVEGLDKQFSPVLGPDFTRTLRSSMATGGLNADLLAGATEHGKTLLALTGGDVEQALKLSENKELIKQLNEQADTKHFASIPAKMQGLTAFVADAATKDENVASFVGGLPKNARGQTMVPYAQLAQVNGMLPKDAQFTSGELRTLRENPGLAIQSGVQPPELALRIEEGAVSNKPEIVKLQEALKGAVVSGDGAQAQLLQQAINKALRSDPMAPTTLTNPETGEQRAMRGDSPQVDSLLRQGWITSTAQNTAIHAWVTDAGDIVQATNEQARRAGLKPIIPGSTIEQTNPDGTKTRTTVGPLGLREGGGFGQLNLIGAGSAAGPVMTGAKVISVPDLSKAPAEATPPGSAGGGTPAGSAASPPAGGAPPLTEGAAGNAAPLVQPPATPGYTVTRPNIRSEFKQQQPALPQATQQKLTQVTNTLGLLDKLERGVNLTGGVEGLITTLKADPLWGKIIPGDADKEVALGLVQRHLNLSAQSMIEGVPSNMDMQTAWATQFKLWASQGFNKASIEQMKQVTGQMAVDIISNNQKNYEIPTNVKETLKDLGVDTAKLKVWNGNDVFANTYRTMIETMPDTQLNSELRAVQAGQSVKSKWQVEALRAAAAERQKNPKARVR